MHHIEPFRLWRDAYRMEEDARFAFLSEFNEGSHSVYNYALHPDWVSFGSATLYTNILFVDYARQHAIIELIGEWNDTLENDIMFFKTHIIDPLTEAGITHFVVITENVLNVHRSEVDYYEAWAEHIAEKQGRITFLNMRAHNLAEWAPLRLERFILFKNIDHWRRLSPKELLKQLQNDSD